MFLNHEKLTVSEPSIAEVNPIKLEFTLDTLMRELPFGNLILPFIAATLKKLLARTGIETREPF